MYACHQGELIAIKEQGYLQKDLAEEEYLSSQGKGSLGHAEQRKEVQPKGIALSETPKVPQAPENRASMGKNLEKTLQDEMAGQRGHWYTSRVS